MAKRLHKYPVPVRRIFLTPADGSLWKLANAVVAQSKSPRLTFKSLVLLMCKTEMGKAEVNVTQMTEILGNMQTLLAANPKGVLNVLAGKC